MQLKDHAIAREEIQLLEGFFRDMEEIKFAGGNPTREQLVFLQESIIRYIEGKRVITH